MLSSLILILCIISITNCQFQSYGPYYYPTGTPSDGTFITFGEFNSTHFYIQMVILGDSWFGFGFPNGGTGCLPSSGCTGTFDPKVGCTGNNTASYTSECRMEYTDAIVFGDYGDAQPIAVKEWILGNHNEGSMHTKQDLSYDDPVVSYLPTLQKFEYTVYIFRPYNPSTSGDLISYRLQYPLRDAYDFCWLWALGDGLSYPPQNPHTNRGYQCINYDPTTTTSPTPAPTYLPTVDPTSNPTQKPTKYPSIPGDTAPPTADPTKEPTISPTNSTTAPSTDPTSSPATDPTVRRGDPTKGPTLKPTPIPFDPPTADPTKDPTPQPTIQVMFICGFAYHKLCIYYITLTANCQSNNCSTNIRSNTSNIITNIESICTNLCANIQTNTTTI